MALLNPVAEDKPLVGGELLMLLPGHTNVWLTSRLMEGVARLAVTAEDKRQTREALLGLLACQTGRGLPGDCRRPGGRGGPACLNAADKRQAREALLVSLARKSDCWIAAALVNGVTRVDPLAEEKQQARAVLLARLARQTSAWAAKQLVDGFAQLDPNADEKHHARQILLALLGRQADGSEAAELADMVAGLDAEPEDERRIRSSIARPTG